MRTKTSFITLILFSFLLTSFLGCGSRQKENADPLSASPDSLFYKSTPQGDLKMHFSYPENWKPDSDYPAIVFFFGGAWRTGNIDQFKPQAEYFATRGMVTIRADYRVSGRHGTGPDKCVEDGKSAIRWIREHSKDLGIDHERIVASGGSAGGHVAACTWSVTGLEAEGEDHSISSKPDLLVLYNPVMSTTNEGFIERTGSAEMAEMISPNDHLSSNTPPMIMFYGTDDLLIEGAYATLEIAGELGIHSALWTAESQKHGFFNKSPWLEWTSYLADGFLTQHGYLKGDPEISLPDSVSMTEYQ